ncbi:MAG: LysM peptidoglycan-binding domain-containing protein [Treponema sp.]|nr:LysM peptidoglycan-binding domain-containing protein [Treponema sp.]
MKYLKKKHLKISQKISIMLLMLLIAVPVFGFVDDEELHVSEELHEELHEELYTELHEELHTEPHVELYVDLHEELHNNHFYMESLRLTQLAHETFEFGDYDASAGFAQEAIRFAELSDEFVADNLIAQARRLLNWADANDIETRYPDEYIQGKTYYEVSIAAHADDNLHDAIDAAKKSIGVFASMQVDGVRPSALPSQYTVRTWAGERDCFWTIAGYPWIYGDSWQWRVLYEANRARLPDPNNPNLIEPGFVLDIPSIRGESRQGMWNPNRQ